MVQIREARDGDAQRLADFNQEFNGVSRSSGEIGRFLVSDDSAETVLVAEDSAMVIGFLCLQTLHSFCYDVPWVEITELYVAPSHRRCGAGTALVGEAIRKAAQVGATEVVLRTNLMNEAAKALFDQSGLTRAPHVVFRCSMEPA